MFSLFLILLIFFLNRFFAFLVLIEVLSLMNVFLLVIFLKSSSFYFFLVLIVCEAVLGFSILLHLFSKYNTDLLKL